MTTRIPDWLLERYALGELPPERMEQVRRDLAAEPDGSARLAALQASDRDILAAYPPPAVADGVLRRAAKTAAPANNNRAWMVVLPALAVAAAVALFADLGSVPHTATEIGEPEITRTKGLDPQLLLQRKQDGDAQRLHDGDLARPGDVLQVQYVAGGDEYGVIVSVDGRGNATVHHADGKRAAHLQTDGAVALPAAFELDDAPRFERFFLISGTRPFEVAPVVSAAEALADRPDAATAPLEISGLHVTSFTVRKP
jgi:hypothetical protein